MKLAIKLIAIAVLGLALYLEYGGKEEKKEFTPPPKPVYSQADLQNAMAEVKAEKRVRAAFWEETKYETQLHALVDDDGTRRDGYAQYLCTLLSGHHLTRVHVLIYDYDAYLNRKERHRLGECHTP